ncbi:hypothetical protein FDECE_10265 [Fusarium decemcellulare]|nr:hypothetical protein FDECE_10265 [Fusarium decemcellulare]
MAPIEPVQPIPLRSAGPSKKGHQQREHNQAQEETTQHATFEEEETAKPSASLAKVDKELAKYAASARIDISADDDTRLRKLIDRRVLIVMIVTYFLQSLDKGTLSFASIMGLPQDTGLTDANGKLTQQYSWLTTCIYITILVVEYPQNYIIARVPVAKYLGFSVAAWGAVLCCHAACTNFTGLVIVRTLLGLFESVCQPAFVVLSAMWYKREEQNARVTYWYMMNAVQQIVGGLLAYCFSLINTGPLKSWQWLFLIYGIISVFFGLFVVWYMPDSPMRAKCFSEADKTLMVERVRENQTGLQNRTFKKEQVWDAFMDPQTWCYATIQFCTTLPTSGISNFANIIIKNSLHFTTLQTQLLSMVLGGYILFVLLLSVYLIKKYNQNILTMLGFMIFSFVGTICLMAVPNQTMAQHVGLLISYYITMSFWTAQTMGLSLMSRNVGGATKKSVVIATNFIFWAAGNAIVLISFRWYLVRENKRRDQLAAAGVPEAADNQLVHAFEDMTDRENPNFRYVY